MKQYDRPSWQINGFKSELEYIAADWLNNYLSLDVIYEPVQYCGDSWRYTPDFQSRKTLQFSECKPEMEFANISLYTQFCKSVKNDLIIITPNEIGCLEINKDTKPIDVIVSSEHGDGIEIINCSHCRAISFATTEGRWNCRACGVSEGAHDCTGLGDGSFDVIYSQLKSKNIRRRRYGR